MTDQVGTPAGGEPWMRGQTYRDKYKIGQTTFWQWRKDGLIETRKVGGCVYVKDRLPVGDSASKK
jgi:hypothetical protein